MQTLDQLRSLDDPAEQARAVGPYLEHAERMVIEARKLRRDAIAAILRDNPERGRTPTALARECGVSVTLVKNIRDGKA